MSSDEIAIRVQGLSKCYPIYEAPGHRLKQFLMPRIDTFMGREQRKYYNEFWALKQLDFEIRKGETVGIIGRNGSGKSTLLQLICGTLSPSAGSVETRGRVAALLELGSGFNPDFSGRENVYLNASVLGLGKAGIDARFASIEQFADIGTFIDQPVKSYSSGMVVRLAFAVIAHVDADILVIDEALAVGDMVFTQKCMRFLRGFMQKGTVLFASHDANAVVGLCDRAIWLRKGEMAGEGKASTVMQSYLRASFQDTYGDALTFQPVGATEEPASAAGGDDVTARFTDNLTQSPGWQTGEAEIESVELTGEDGQPMAAFQGGEVVNLSIRARCSVSCTSPILGWFVKDRLGQVLFGEHTFTHAPPPMLVPAGGGLVARFRFRLPMLPNGDYAMTVSIAEGTPEDHVQHHWLHDAMLIKVASTKMRYGLVGIPFESVTMEQV